MEDKNNHTQDRNSESDRPVHIVRRGAVAASIWQRRREEGGSYFEYTLSRSWQSRDGKRRGYSPNFFSRNIGELSDVIDEATKWIATREQAALAEDTATDSTEGPSAG